MPIDYSKYPPNWKTEIRPAILKREGNKCKFCGVKNGARGYRDKDGIFHEFKLGGYQPKYCGIRIVLTVAHLNHDITDSRPENLAALCQKCHLTHDAAQHKATRQQNRSRNQPELFEEREK